MVNPTHQENRDGYAYTCHPLVRPLYIVYDALADTISIFTATSEEKYREELNQLAHKLKRKEDRAGFPSMLDRILSGFENLIKIDDSDDSKQDKAA
jgi:hypothetical protein